MILNYPIELSRGWCKPRSLCNQCFNWKWAHWAVDEATDRVCLLWRFNE